MQKYNYETINLQAYQTFYKPLPLKHEYTFDKHCQPGINFIKNPGMGKINFLI